jgi:glucose-1-phosphate thymidylyltransferase
MALVRIRRVNGMRSDGKANAFLMKESHMAQGWKGIILAGGSGKRLYPITREVSKQLLPVYDKPMIYYPLSVLMLAGIREILIISTPQDLGKFRRLLKNGDQLGLRFYYAEQPRPEGLAQAFIIGQEFIGKDKVCLILGDNLFFGHGLEHILHRAVGLERGGLIFGYQVKNPESYGVVEFDTSGKVIGIEEKPAQPRSRFAVPGLYFFDNDASAIASSLKPSRRGELEIADLISEYLRRGELRVELLGRGFAWLDTGTPDALYEARSFVEAIEKRQGLKIACIEEVAYRMGYINADQVRRLALDFPKTDYGKYLYSLVDS